jgi:integrase
VKDALPPRVFRKGASYYLVTADGPKRIWKRLSRVKDGLPAMYRALASLMHTDAQEGRMPGLIAAWEKEVMPRHAERTQKDERARGRILAEAFAEFAADQVQAKHVAEFLRALRSKPRTHNLYRAQIRDLLRYAVELGLRTDNPVEHIRTMPERARSRYITDSELRRIKVAAMTGDDGRRTRSGAMLCALVDMAYLTGQRIGDLLALEWGAFGPAGIAFQPLKTRGSTAARIIIEWTPRLRDVERRLRELRKARRGFAPQVFTTQDGKGYTYWGASTAWRRAVKRAGLRDVHFHDLRGKALTDKEASEGMTAARLMGTHSTEAQTADYVRAKVVRKTGATR